MENLTCQMNCKICNLQQTNEAKVMCATLLMPAMFAQLIGEIAEIKELLNKKETSIEVPEIKLPEKPKKPKLNEYN